MAKPPVDLDKLYAKNPEIKDAAKLRSILEKEERRPNVLTLREFERYLPLYQKLQESFPTIEESNRYDAMINNLSKEYCRRINLYKPTHIVASTEDQTPLLVIPPTFVTISSVKPDQESEQAISTFFKDGNSEIPARVMRAEAGLLEALKRAYQDPENLARHRQASVEAKAAFDDFMEKKFPGLFKRDTQKTTTPATKVVATNIQDAYAGDAEDFL